MTSSWEFVIAVQKQFINVCQCLTDETVNKSQNLTKRLVPVYSWMETQLVLKKICSSSFISYNK